MRFFYAILERWALLGLVGQLVGAILIGYGLRVSPDSGAMYHFEGRAYHHFVLRAARPWAYRLGWLFILIGIALQMVPEVLAALAATR
jgi:hypothetical protein